MELLTRYIGALPSRDRASSNLYSDLRKLSRPGGPRVFEKSIETPTAQAFVLSGFYGADETNRADARALSMASRILSTRMIEEVREKDQLVYSIGASSRSGFDLSRLRGLLRRRATDPPKVPALVEKLASMYETFAKDGPTDDEMNVAKKQMAVTYEEQLKNPSFWSGRLSQLTFRGVSLDDLMSEPDSYQTMSAQDVQDTFAKYYAKDKSIIVIVKPKQGGNAESGSAGSSGNADR